jgi:hypothetical protein
VGVWPPVRLARLQPAGLVAALGAVGAGWSGGGGILAGIFALGSGLVGANLPAANVGAYSYVFEAQRTFPVGREHRCEGRQPVTLKATVKATLVDAHGLGSTD